jgi:hypothetical protein
MRLQACVGSVCVWGMSLMCRGRDVHGWVRQLDAPPSTRRWSVEVYASHDPHQGATVVDDGGVSSRTYTPAFQCVRVDSAYFLQLATTAEADLAEEREREASRVKTDRALGKQMMEEFSRVFPELDSQCAKDKDEEDAASQEYIKHLLRNKTGAGASGEGGSCDDAVSQALIKKLLQDEAGDGAASNEGLSSRHTAQVDEEPTAGDSGDVREQVCSKASE